MLVMLALVAGFVVFAPALAHAEPVAQPSQQDIVSFLESHPIDVVSDSTYDEEPSTAAPYAPGRLSNQSMQDALNYLNLARYVAGVPANVTLNESYVEYAQASALVNALNGSMSHDPVRPSGMYDELYEMGHLGASRSNLGMGYFNLSRSISGQLSDSGSSNISRVGHRRWLLCPSLTETGFGHVGSFTSVYVIGDGSSSGQTGIAWPARTMPLELFWGGDAWSYSMPVSSLGDDPKVELVRKSDGRVWTFSSASADGEFYVNRENYGRLGCIIFRPSGIQSYGAGDSYTVKVTGTKADETYEVTFFDMIPDPEPEPEPDPEPEQTPDPDSNQTPEPDQTPEPSPDTQPAQTRVMHRLYNKWTGEHFYTASDEEKANLVSLGWTDEGTGWVAPATSSTPVYRLYNKYVPGGDHHYTTSASECDACVAAGWSYEGIGWYSDDAKGEALLRQYNPFATTGTHNYTTSREENDILVRAGWRAEGVAWYGVAR